MSRNGEYILDRACNTSILAWCTDRIDVRERRMFLLTLPENLPIKPDPLRSFTESPMAQTIFGKIIAGQIPCHRVYEDERVPALLDIIPLSRGHRLVVPKEPAESLDQLSEESAAALGRVLPRICRAVVAVTGVRNYNVLENNGAEAHQAVRHVHFHIIPKPNAA